MPRRRSNNLRRRQRRRPRTRKTQNLATKPPTVARMQPERAQILRVPLFPISKRLRTQLYYEPDINMSMPGSGNAINYVYSANGIFDVNITSTGHQPMGFDQMMLLYEQATVLSSTIVVRFMPTVPAVCAVSLSPDTSTLTNPAQIVENGLCRQRLYSGVGAQASVNATALTQERGITLSCRVASYFGRKTDREIINDDNLYTTAAANPVEQVYYIISAWQFRPDGSTSHVVDFDVQLVYDVVYWEPRKLAIS